MKRKTIFALSISIALLFTGCGMYNRDKITEKETAYHKITAEEAKNKIEKGNVTIVDVRTKEEYDLSHIPEAILLPLDSINYEFSDERLDKEAVLLIYCRSGKRSKQAAEKLIELGYRNVYDFGGIMDWPYETEGKAES